MKNPINIDQQIIEHIQKHSRLYVGSPKYSFVSFFDHSRYHNNDGQERVRGWQYSVLRALVELSIDRVLHEEGVPRIDITLEDNNVVTIRNFHEIASIDNELQMSLDKDYITCKPGCLFRSDFMIVVAVALFPLFEIHCYKQNTERLLIFSNGRLITDQTKQTSEKDGTFIKFDANNMGVDEFHYNPTYVEMIVNYLLYLAPNVTINFNGKVYKKINGLKDLLDDKLLLSSFYDCTSTRGLQTIRLRDDHIEFAFTLCSKHEFLSFVNGVRTWKGDHESAFKKSFLHVLQKYFNISSGESKKLFSEMAIAIKVNMEKPIFEDSSMLILGSRDIVENVSFSKYMNEFLQIKLVEYFDEHEDIVNTIRERINKIH